jgi:hypothetical protein
VLTALVHLVVDDRRGPPLTGASSRKEDESMNESELLQSCVQRLGSRLDSREECELEEWWHGTREEAALLAGSLTARDHCEWTEEILNHRAHRHPWYEQLAHEVSLEAFAAFLLENRAFPAFLPLVQRALDVQISEEGRAAVLRNINDEQVPVPHTDLMRRMMGAIKARVGDRVRLESFPSLIDRTLVFYYGYYCDPWHLVGSLYAMESMAQYRMSRMDDGLRRLGFQDADLEFISIHLHCDDDHARDWSDGVVGPSIRLDPDLRIPIAQGIAACLETSARYLDDLSLRARKRFPGYSTRESPVSRGEVES